MTSTSLGDAESTSRPQKPAFGWPVDTILQWFGVASLGLILLFNAPEVQPRLDNLTAWTLESWIVALAAALNVLVFGLVTRDHGSRLLGSFLVIGLLVLTPGSALAQEFFASAGGFIVMYAILLLGTAEFVRFLWPRHAEPSPHDLLAPRNDS